MIEKQYDGIIERLWYTSLGVVVTLYALTRFNVANLAFEFGVSLLISVGLFSALRWSAWKRSEGRLQLSGHQIVAWSALFVAMAVVLADFSFGVGSIGGWALLPISVSVFAIAQSRDRGSAYSD